MTKKPKKKFVTPECKDFISRVDFEKEIKVTAKFFEAKLVGGNLKLIAGSPGSVKIKLQWQENAEGLLPNFYLDGDTIRLESKGFKAFKGQKNIYIAEVTLPPEIYVKAKMFAGVIFIDGLTGPIDASLKFGEIIGVTSSKIVNFNVIAGSIKVHHLTGNARAKVKMGDVELLFDRVSKGNKIDLYCFMGDIKMSFPVGVIVSTDRKVKNGIIPNNIGADIRASVTVGDNVIDNQTFTTEPLIVS